jgi:ABC-type nickel/cobalt efflux system permease component RcnA
MRKLVAALAVAVALVAPVAAQAHPLGNFTINRFARVEVSGSRLYVRYVLDMAEIPTFQARQNGVRPAAYARALAEGLHVTVDGRRATLVPLAHVLAFPRGVGGLHTMRLEAIFRGPLVTRRESLVVRDTNYRDHIGWKEIVVGARSPSVSGELRAYPKSLLQSGGALEAPDRVADSGFTRLIATGHLSVLVILASLIAALFWGAAHALSPGHGKTIVTAYLIGKRGTPRDAALLGAIVTVTHTIGVFGLGLVTLALSQWIVPDRLYPWIDIAAGLLVVSIGLGVLVTRAWHALAHHHGHHHHHHHGDAVTGRSLLAIGVSGGLLPCPSALVVLLAAISLHRLAFGLVLIVAFSIGLALSITCIGFVALLAKNAFARRSFDGPVVRALPALSTLAILVAGVAMMVHAIPKVH